MLVNERNFSRKFRRVIRRCHPGVALNLLAIIIGLTVMSRADVVIDWNVIANSVE
jgi:hypothetical protein